MISSGLNAIVRLRGHVLFALFLPMLIALAGPSAAEEVPVPKGERLRAIVARQFPDGNVYIGSASHHRLLDTPTALNLAREFGYVTPANKFKQTTVHPGPGLWSWHEADDWLDFCKANGQVMRIHGPISPQCSTWAKDDSRTAEELAQNLEEYMTALCRHIREHPQVKWMDVVNETVSKGGDWFGPSRGVRKWENPWPKIGYDESSALRPPLYIKMAFEIANREAPNIKQIINQHLGMDEAAWDKVKAVVAYLRERNLRVDGIGWQAHIDAGWEKEGDNIKRLGALIDWAHANKLEFHVTENNAFTYKSEDWEKQAATFKAIVETLLSRRGTGVVAWNLWHLRDSECQRSKDRGCMWFEDYTPKPAYYAVQKTLLNPPATEEKP